MFRVIKTYGHDLGISAAFRQHRADSHCRFLHGYPLSFEFQFTARERDSRGWVIDFGALKPLKEQLLDQFDHKTLVAGDDPALAIFQQLHDRGLVDLRVMPDGVGCEAFALWAHKMAHCHLLASGHAPRVSCTRVVVSEHGANRAVFESTMQ